MQSDDTNELKRLTIIALVSDDELVQRLVLKGGNALSLVHGQSVRASFDLDFSLEGAFEPHRLSEIAERIGHHLRQTFEPAGYVAFDVRLEPKPDNITPDLEEFWGGYNLEFKLIARTRYDELAGDLRAIRRAAIPSRPGGRARFQVDISRHEYCTGKQAVEIERFTVFVYTPQMIVCEKIRAICQQTSQYAQFVQKHRAPRARDFFDIHETIRRFKIDLYTTETLDLLENMFRAKRVPLQSLLAIEGDLELHRQDWASVMDTVDPTFQLRDFDYYFQYVANHCKKLAHELGANPRGT